MANIQLVSTMLYLKFFCMDLKVCIFRLHFKSNWSNHQLYTVNCLDEAILSSLYHNIYKPLSKDWFYCAYNFCVSYSKPMSNVLIFTIFSITGCLHFLSHTDWGRGFWFQWKCYLPKDRDDFCTGNLILYSLSPSVMLPKIRMEWILLILKSEIVQVK